MASDPHPLVRAFRPDEWRVYRELRLRALADSPDAFGSTLAAEQGGSDEDWAARLARGAASENDLPLVTERGRRAVGLLWARIDPADARTAHLYQMWVTPDCRRAGAGRLLLETAISWARSRNVRTVVLGVSGSDGPAVHLYRSAGFEAAGAPEPIRPGSRVLAQRMTLDLTQRGPVPLASDPVRR